MPTVLRGSGPVAHERQDDRDGAELLAAGPNLGRTDAGISFAYAPHFCRETPELVQSIHTITIDTHAAIRNLQEAGADPKLAEAIVATVSRADTELATKSDLSALEGRLTTAGYRLAIGVVIANSVIVFGLLKLVMPA